MLDLPPSESESLLSPCCWPARHWIPQSSLYKRDWTPLPAAKEYEDLVLHKWWTRWTGSADQQGLVEVRAFFGKRVITAKWQES